jgi:hypothetical protein
VCAEALRRPDGFAQQVELERKQTAVWLADYRAAGSKAVEMIFPPNIRTLFGDRFQHFADLQDELEQLAKTNPQSLGNLWDATQQRVDAYFHGLAEEAQKAPWERQFDRLEIEDKSLPGRLARVVLPPVENKGGRITRVNVMLRLLAVHAAILRHRWEFDTLPNTLAELRLAEVALDPYTGTALNYERTGAKYRLWSAGPEARPGSSSAVGGREPLTIGPDS